jgi:hypothetical protein
MKHLVILLVFSALFSFNLPAEPVYWGADPIWERKEAQNPSFMGSNVTRNIAFAIRDGQKKLYVASRPGDPSVPNVYVVGAETGNYDPDDVLLYDDDLVQGGHFVLNTVGVTEDNVVVASSMSSNLSGDVQRKFRVYAWDTDASMARLLLNVDNIVTMSEGLGLITSEANKIRIGDKMTVTGRLDNGTAKLYLPNYNLQATNGNLSLHPTIYVFYMIPDGTGFKFSETPQLVDVPINDLAPITNASVSVLSDGSYFWTAI